MEIFESNLTDSLLSGVSVCTNKMLPSKSKRSETRRSSILKPRKPRQPLQNVNLDSSSNENSPTASKVKRRVSFAEKKHVKEFCHTNEQGTVWDNTYEEHDFSLKGSFVADQNAEAESRENTSLYASNNDCININSDSNSCYPNNAYLANNQLSQESVKRAGQDNDTNCDLDFTNPIKSMELCDISQLGCAILPSKSCVSKDTIASDIVVYNDTDEECMELSKSQSRQTVITNASYISENVKSKNITIYRDSDEENCVDNVANKYESYSNHVNSELDMTRAQNMSIELTAPICASLLSSHLHAEEQEEHEHNDVNNFDTNYPTSCNNVSMEITEAIPIFTKSATSDLEIPKQIPTTLQNCENTKWDAANSNTISSTILQSNVSEDIISEHTSDVNYANDSMILTSVIQPFIDVTGTGTCSTNNTAFNTSIEMIVPPKIDEKNTCNENIVKGNDLRKDHYYATDKTEVFNDSPMEMTKPVSTILPSNVIDKENFRVNEPISRDDRTILFHNISMEMTKTVSTRNKQEITDTITCKPLSEENAHSKKDVNTLGCFTEGILCKSTPNYANDSMTLTSVIQPFIDITGTGTCSTNNTAFNTSIEMIVPPKIDEKNTCNENIVKGNDLRNDHYYATDKTEVFNDLPMEMTKPVSTILPSNVIDKENFRVDEPISRDDRTTLFHNISIEMTKTVSTRNKQEITDTITCKPLSEENAHSKKDVNTLACFTEGILCKSTPNYANDSMTLTSVIQPFIDITGTGTCSTNNTPFNTSIEMIVPPKIDEKNTCNENIVKGNDLRKDHYYATDKTEVFNDSPMEMTKPVNTILPSNVNDKENFRVDEPISRDDRTILFHNISMEMTKTVSIRNKQEITDTITCKPLSEKNAHSRKDVNTLACFTEGILCKSMPNYANDSMTLTSVIQPFIDVTGTDTCSTNNTAFNTSIEMIVPPKIDEKNTCNDNIVKGNDLRKDHYYATDKTEVFNDSPMEMTKPVSTILSSNVNDKENFRVDEPISRDDRTILFRNISMEMTKTVSTRNKQEITDTITCKPLSEENAHSRKDVNTLACFTEGILCKSMELTETVPYDHERIFYAADAQSVSKSTCDHKNDKTKFVNDESMEITKSINILPSSIDKENLKIHESVSKNDKTMHNVFMEMTTAVSPRNREEITLPISCKSISKEHINGEKDTNSSTCFNEETKLCKSMEFTEVPISLHDEKTFNTTHTTQSTSFSQTLSKMYLPAENSTGVAFQTDAIANETIQDISMEITAAVPSTSHLTQDEKMNKTENLIISKDDGFQHLTTNINQTESRKSVTKENLTISREIVEIENIRHDELSNTIVTQSPLDNLVHSLNANLEKSKSRKRMSDENERSNPKRIRNSFMEVQSSQENDIHSFPNTNVNDIERNECFEDMIDHTQVPDSNRRDNLNEIGEYSFLRKSLPYLENSLEELQSIKPPSFVCLDSEEENSFHKIQHELQASTITNIPINNISNPLTINNVAESKCLIDSRKNVANDFTILREKEIPINIENNLEESCHGSTIMNKIEDKQETNCQVITKTIINDDQFNKSNYYMIENIKEPSILSMNANDGKTVQDVNHCTSLIIKEIEVIDDEDQVDERTYIQKRINEDAKLQNNIKEKRQSLDKKRQEIEECSDDFESTRTIIKNQISPEEHRTNLNGEEIQQNMEQKDECATERLVTEQHVNTIENVKNISLTEQDPFLTLLQKLETYAASEDCIWDICYKNIDKKMIVFGFMSNSLLIATFLSYDFNGSEENLIKEIKIISRVSDNAGVLIRIAHKLILEKVNAEILINLYRTHQDILPMLNFISQDVKLAMDFMFDLRRLDDLNLMEIVHDKISFVSRSKLMDIILKVTIKVKRFDKLTSNDVNICCLLGRIKETDIKNLIKNIKRDHKFLRRYMNDVKDYIDIMEETFK